MQLFLSSHASEDSFPENPIRNCHVSQCATTSLFPWLRLRIEGIFLQPLPFSDLIGVYLSWKPRTFHSFHSNETQIHST